MTAEADAANCASFSLEEDSVPDPKHEHPDQSFLLGFVEFDDQGRPYNREQITTLFDRIEMEAQYRDLLPERRNGAYFAPNLERER